MSKKGRLFVVSAPSGAGKTTLCEKLIKVLPNLVRSVSMTTRKRRSKEKNGKDYFFVSEAQFKKKIKNKEFLEYAKVFGSYYGTPREFVEKKLDENIDVLLTIDVQGAMRIRKIFKKNAVFIFIVPPTLKDLQLRLLKRKTDTQKEIRQRLQVAKKELKYLKFYDARIVNEDLNAAFEQLRSIFIKQKKKPKKNR